MVKKTYGKYSIEELDKINKQIMLIQNPQERQAMRQEIREKNKDLAIALMQYSISLMKEDGTANKMLEWRTILCYDSYG